MSAPAFAAANVNITAANVAAGAHDDLTITNAAAIGANPPEWFKVYRGRPKAATSAVSTTPADYSLIMQVPTASQVPAGLTAFDDRNIIMPFTSLAYLGQNDESVLTVRQLAPLMKLDLAVTAPGYRWTVLWFGAPILFAPRKWLRFLNVRAT